MTCKIRFTKFYRLYFKTLFGFKNFSRPVQKWKQSRTFKDRWSPCNYFSMSLSASLALWNQCQWNDWNQTTRLLAFVT